VTIVLDEHHTEHRIEVFAGEVCLTDDVDFPEEEAYDTWWLMIGEGIVFGDGEHTTVHFAR